MHNSFRVEVANRHTDLSCVEADHVFTQSLLGFEYFVQLTTFNKRHDEVESVFWLEQVVHTYEEGVITTEQNILF